jgi:hypothetical protein
MSRKSRLAFAALVAAMWAVPGYTAISARAEIPSPPPGKVSVTFTDYPTAVQYGQVVTYKMDVTNYSNSNKDLLLVFTVADTVAPRKGGGPLAAISRHIKLLPGEIRSIKFPLMIAPDVNNHSGYTCITVWANSLQGSFTCAALPGMK